MVSLVIAGYIHLANHAKEVATQAIQAHELKRLEVAHRDVGNLFAGREDFAECKRRIENLKAEIEALKFQKQRRRR